MDIRKSQRLSQFLSVISDMVQYSDIGKYMVGSGMISSDEHEFLQRKLEIQDNSCVMNELLTMVNLRYMVVLNIQLFCLQLNTYILININSNYSADEHCYVKYERIFDKIELQARRIRYFPGNFTEN